MNKSYTPEEVTSSGCV